MMQYGALRQLMRARPRLLSSLLLGGVVYAALPDHLRPSFRVMAAWDAGAICYLSLAIRMFAVSTLAHTRQRAALQDENAWIFLLLTCAAALFSLLSITLVLHGANALAQPFMALHLGLAGGTIICSWALVHVMFALHYAHGFYQREAAGGAPPSLRFPDEDHPDYWDFCYFSFVIGMTCQVSDVEIADRGLRRTALAHGVLAFFFNTIILALSINIAAGLL